MLPMHDRRRIGGTPVLMKRKILASLFVISSVIGLGVFATGAYFTDTITQDNYTFTAGTADLKLAFCGPVGTDCRDTAATIDNITFSSPAQDVMTGPGKSGVECIVVENKGAYALTLSSQLTVTGYSHPNMAVFFQVAAENANGTCNSTGVFARGWATAANEAGAGQVPLGITLAPGGRAYFLTENRWDSTGDQNYLQGGFLKLKTVIEGRTV
jgi:hypothetical protein